jgi:hypothetical protein
MCIIIIIITLLLDFSVADIFLVSIWKQLMKVELESALRDLGMACINVPSKDTLEGS